MDKKRILFFLVGCIGTRTAITALAYVGSPIILRALSCLALLFVLGWLWILFISPRTTGPEVSGERIWWNKLRPIHAILWSLFAYLAFQGDRRAWTILALDTLFGLIAFLCHHRLF